MSGLLPRSLRHPCLNSRTLGFRDQPLYARRTLLAHLVSLAESWASQSYKATSKLACRDMALSYAMDASKAMTVNPMSLHDPKTLTKNLQPQTSNPNHDPRSSKLEPPYPKPRTKYRWEWENGLCSHDL